MPENHSFEHIVGDCPKVKKVDGAPGGRNVYRVDEYKRKRGAARQVAHDPNHDTKDLPVQLGASEGVQENGDFALDYACTFPELKPDTLREVMKSYAYKLLPAFHELAQNYLVCDRWHASMPGPTWVNRLFAFSGTGQGVVNLSLHWYNQGTVFDRLNEKKWKVYFGDTPLSLLFVHNWSSENALRHQHIQACLQDAAGPEEDFPDFALIEPAYMNPGANDAHPPHGIVNCDALVAKVYNAIRANDSLSLDYPEAKKRAVPLDHYQSEYTKPSTD